MHYGVFGLSVFVRLIPLVVFYYSSSARKITRELTILEGQPPLYSRPIKFYWESVCNHFHFQAKIEKPKNY